MNNAKISVSNILIILSLLCTLAAMYIPELYQFGMNRDFFMQKIYHIWVLQFFTSQFLHGNIFHFLGNAFFIGYFGNTLEQELGSKKILIFFILNSIFLGLTLTFLGSGNTVGISGFALALLTYYTLLLWKRGDREYTGGITAIIINIIVGFAPGISFLGHFFGMIFGALFFFLSIKNARKKVGEYNL